MPTLTAIDNASHRNLRVDIEKCLSEQENTHLIPVVLPEFARLSSQYPLMFVKHADTGRFVPVALMGLDTDENLFIEGGQLESFCMPLNLARQPFFLGVGETDQDDMVMCVDQDHCSVGEHLGERIFDAQGEQTQLLKDAGSILATLYQSDAETAAFVDELLKQELLVSTKLDITYDDGTQSHVDGLYSIDEEKLAMLNAEQLTALHQQRYLSAAYAMLVSLGQVQAMIFRKNQSLAQVV